MTTIKEEKDLPKEEAPMNNIGFDVNKIDERGEIKNGNN